MDLTNRFAPPRRSDQSVLQPFLWQWQDLSFLITGIPIRPFHADATIILYGCFYQGGLLRYQDPGPEQTTSSTPTVWSSSRRPWLCITGLQCYRLPGHDCYRQHHGSALYPQPGEHRPTIYFVLVVDLFLWLHSQDIVLGARHNVTADYLSRPNQPITMEWSLHC